MNTPIDNLQALRNAGEIADIDLQLCRLINRHYSQTHEAVLLAVCMTSYHYRQGDICLPLERYAGQTVFDSEHGIEGNWDAPELDRWTEMLDNSAAIGRPGEAKPAILDSYGCLYLQKAWHYEQLLGDHLLRRARRQREISNPDLFREGLERLFGNEGETPDWQKVSAVAAACSSLTIISGGPGTGKTSTVVRILALLTEQALDREQPLSIALAAPTGKAASRITEAVREGKQRLNCRKEVTDNIPDTAQTLHRLLGARLQSSKFRHDRDNPLAYDLVVIDEASMVDQALMYHLSEALLDHTRVIMLGDKDQLASVEAGSVFGNICNPGSNTFTGSFIERAGSLGISIPETLQVENPRPLTDRVVLLTKSYRFAAESGIAALSNRINRGEATEALAVLDDGNYPEVSLSRYSGGNTFGQWLEGRADEHLIKQRKAQIVEEAMQGLREFRILCGHRRGPLGSERINELMERRIKQERGVSRHRQWYEGRPIMVTSNDYTLGLRNGDVGITRDDGSDGLMVYFERSEGWFKASPGRLSHSVPAYAMTVHKSQGSEFNRVALVLPEQPSQVLSRELIYTAVTRCRESCLIWSSEEVLVEGIKRRLSRTSGLQNRLWKTTGNNGPSNGKQLGIFNGE